MAIQTKTKNSVVADFINYLELHRHRCTCRGRYGRATAYFRKCNWTHRRLCCPAGFSQFLSTRYSGTCDCVDCHPQHSPFSPARLCHTDACFRWG